MNIEIKIYYLEIADECDDKLNDMRCKKFTSMKYICINLDRKCYFKRLSSLHVLKITFTKRSKQLDAEIELFLNKFK